MTESDNGKCECDLEGQSRIVRGSYHKLPLRSRNVETVRDFSGFVYIPMQHREATVAPGGK